MKKQSTTKQKLYQLKSLKRNRDRLDFDYIKALDPNEIQFLLDFAENYTKEDRYKRENDLTTTYTAKLRYNKLDCLDTPTQQEDLNERIEREAIEELALEAYYTANPKKRPTE